VDRDEILDEVVEVEVEETVMAAVVVVAVVAAAVEVARSLGLTDMITTCPKKRVLVFRFFRNLKFIA
jgi:hypothetical protein